MPRIKRPRRDRTHDWHYIQQWTLWPEQKVYELLRPVVLFNESASERAKETGASERTLQYKAVQFEERGMASLFPKEPESIADRSRSLPPDMRQLIVDLQADYPAFRPHEIATICFVRFGRKPSPHSVKRVLADGPRPSITTRRFPPYGQITDPFQRRRAIVQLHAEGWNSKTIALYMQTTRTRVYEILQRWVTEGLAGLHDKSHAPHEPARKVTFEDMNEVRRLAHNPDLGAYRVRAALEQIGIKLSQATCGRLLALNRRLYGLETPKRSPGTKKEMPSKPCAGYLGHPFGKIENKQTSAQWRGREMLRRAGRKTTSSPSTWKETRGRQTATGILRWLSHFIHISSSSLAQMPSAVYAAL